MKAKREINLTSSVFASDNMKSITKASNFFYFKYRFTALCVR